MLDSLPIRLLWHSLNWLTRLAIALSASLAVLLAFGIIAMRYWVMPEVGQYHDRIVASLSSAVGNPVTIEKIEGDWRGLHPRLNLTGVTILDAGKRSALVLPRVDGSVSWMSMLTGELRLASLEVDSPDLLVRRDAQGQFYVGGVAMKSSGGGNDLSNWLLHQSRMVVRNARILWIDELRNAPPLELADVNLRIENFFNRHQFALRALPPKELSTPLDVRGDFHGESFDDLNAWEGQLYTRLDHTDVTAWRPWLDLPSQFSRGRGALRGWLGIAQGRISGVMVDVGLRGVVTRLADDLPELSLHDLQGRASWKAVDGDLEIDTKRLSMRLVNGIALKPTDFHLRISAGHKGKAAGGEMSANLLQLETLTALGTFVPLGDEVHRQLAAYDPHGKVENFRVEWKGALESPAQFRIKGSFERLAMRQVGALPGFAGLSADIDGSELSGRLNIDARNLVVDAPGTLVEPLTFATLTGQAGWKRDGRELEFRADNVAFSNEDVAGNLYGDYRSKQGTLGILDLTVALTRGDVTKAYRYTPLIALEKEGNDWLKDALRAGHTEDFRVRIKGNISDFPADGQKDVVLELGGHARDVVLAFHPDWPAIDNIQGEFRIRGNKLEVKSPSARLMGAELHNVTVAVPDLLSPDLPLEIAGVAQGTSATFLDFVQQSPVRGYIDGFTDGIKASGNANLGLNLHIPLLGDAPVKVSGSLHVEKNDIDLGDGAPLLRNAKGALSFTESGMQAENVQAEILGGPARIDLKSGDGGAVHAQASGRCNFDALRRANPLPVLERLHGQSNWKAEVSVVNKYAELNITSDLRGIVSTLPAPFAKRAQDAMPLRIEKRIATEGQDVIELQLGKLLNARLARRVRNGDMAIERGAVVFGGQQDIARWMKREGVWLAGNLPQLSLEGWSALTVGLSGGAGDAATPDIPLGGAELRIGSLDGYGLHVADMGINAARRGEGMAATLSSAALNGEVEWQPRGGGKLSAHLQNLDWAGRQPVAPAAAQPKTSVQPKTAAQSGMDMLPSSLPTMQLSIDSLKVAGKSVGRFEVVGHPEGSDWRLRRLNVVNPDGSLSGDGVWHGDGKRGLGTEVNLLLQISDAGKILARSGYPDTVKGGSGKLSANLGWDGGPFDAEVATLHGQLKLDTGKGQFLKMDPGMGKLLGVLSLQSLPRRVALDFGDVFSQGFQFDSIAGNATINHGIIETHDLHLDGSAAKVKMKGSADLNRETQDLRITVLPTLGDSVSLIGAIAAGPVVGLGALIANKVLGDPLDKLASFEYNVTGSWANPNVVKVGERKPQAASQE